MIKYIGIHLVFISTYLLAIEVEFINAYYDSNNLTKDLRKQYLPEMLDWIEHLQTQPHY